MTKCTSSTPGVHPDHWPGHLRAFPSPPSRVTSCVVRDRPGLPGLALCSPASSLLRGVHCGRVPGGLPHGRFLVTGWTGWAGGLSLPSYPVRFLVSAGKTWEKVLLRKSVVSDRLQRLLQPKLLK